MRNKRINFSALLLLVVFAVAQAQNTMYVKETNNSITSFPLNDISKITFQSGNMLVKQNSGTTTPFVLTDISRYNFAPSPVGISKIKDDELAAPFIFPNPGSTQIQLNYYSLESRATNIDIIDSKGTVVQQLNEKSLKGKNKLSIDVSKLSQGLYLFRIHNEYDTETINFLKN